MFTRHRRLITVFVVAILIAAVAAIVVHVAHSSDSSGTWYACVNAGGKVESVNGGVTVPTCAHKTDRIKTWSVSDYTPPPPVTTAPVTTVPRTTAVTTAQTSATTSVTTPVTTSVTPTTIVTAGIWHPTAKYYTWDWVISTVPTPHAGLNVIDTDGFDNTAANVAAWHAFGTIAICYIDVGTAEPGRPDLALIPTADRGSSVSGFATEKWLNIADLAGLEPMINERLAMCKSKGFDAVEADDVDGYTNPTGFPLTAANQIAYNTYVANTAHADGLSVGLKNDTEQMAALEPSFDWVLDEQCNEFSECNTLAAFTAANKAAFNAEYAGGTAFCAADAAAKINGGAFNVNLDGTGHTACPAW